MLLISGLLHGLWLSVSKMESMIPVLGSAHSRAALLKNIFQDIPLGFEAARNRGP